jgi:molecular chaperone HtpG
MSEFPEAKKLIKKQSEFFRSPTTLYVEKSEEKEVSDDEDEPKTVKTEGEDEIEDVDEKKIKRRSRLSSTNGGS